MESYLISIDLVDGCTIERIIEKDSQSIQSLIEELVQLKNISSVYIDSDKGILIVHPDKVRNITVIKL